MADPPLKAPRSASRAGVRVLGIDPGLADLGYGVVEQDNRTRKIRHLEHGSIRTSADDPIAQRLQKIHDRLADLIEAYSPDEVAIEELFFAANVTSAISVAQARGVAILASGRSGVSVGEYSPKQIKLAITGSGKAPKRQVQMMVKAMLDLEAIPKPDHAADALAVAICHLHHSQPVAQARKRAREGDSDQGLTGNKALLAQQRSRRRR